MVVNYIYDAWGNHAVVDASGNDITDTGHIGNVNPFRYRGYYYDTETGLYYLQTRYYDPELGRFISQDSVDYADPEKINGLNLYAYCANNPVMGYDPTGTTEWWEWLFGIFIIVAAVAISILTAGLAAPIAAAVGGGLTGAIVGGAVVGAIGGAVIGFGFSVGSQTITKGFNNIDWDQVGTETLYGAFTGMVTGGFFGGLKFVASPSSIANSLSGLRAAQNAFFQASNTLKSIPIIIQGGVMTTDRIAAQLGFNVASGNLASAQSAYKVLELFFSQLYRLAQFGLKRLIGTLIKGKE